MAWPTEPRRRVETPPPTPSPACPRAAQVVMPLGHSYFGLRGVDTELGAVCWYLLYFVLSVLGSFSLSLISYLLVEKPLINLRPAG